jgi:glutaminase
VLVPSFLITVLVPLRWGNIPLDDAVQFNHLEVVKLLQDYQDTYAVSETQVETAAMSKENLESMV